MPSSTDKGVYEFALDSDIAQCLQPGKQTGRKRCESLCTFIKVVVAAGVIGMLVYLVYMRASTQNTMIVPQGPVSAQTDSPDKRLDNNDTAPELALIREELHSINSQLNEIMKWDNGIDKMDELLHKMEDMTNQMDGLNHLNRTFMEIRQYVARIKELLTTVSDRLNNIETGNGELQDLIQKNDKKIGEMRSEMKNHFDGIDSKLLEMQRQKRQSGGPGNGSGPSCKINGNFYVFLLSIFYQFLI